MKKLKNILNIKTLNSQSQIQEITNLVQTNGYLLLRGLNMDVKEFEQKMISIIGKPMDYEVGSNSRTNLSSKVLSPGTEPAHINLQQHNEMAYADKWPSMFCLTCFNPPNKGEGITPIANTMQISREIPKEMNDKLLKYGVSYVRRLHDQQNKNDIDYYNDWQSSFLTQNKSEVIDKCNQLNYNYKFDEHNNLEFKYTKPSHIYHEKQNQEIFFNQIYSIWYWWIDWSPFDKISREKWPYYVEYGNGDKFTDKEMQILHDIYQENTIGEEWQKGDILILENQLFSHGRTPYNPNSQRKIGVMMGSPVQRLNTSQTNGVSQIQYL